MKYFDDYLNLAEQKTTNFDFIIFYGHSGAGKSSYINHLNKKHEFVIDEIWKISQLSIPYKVRNKSKTIFVSTHLPKYFYAFYFLFFKVLFVNLNKSKVKIQKELERRNIDYNEESIDIFMNEYGGSFIDLDIVLDEYPSQSFCYSIKKFMKTHQIVKNPKRELNAG